VFTPAPIVQTIVAVVAAIAFLATANYLPAGLVIAAGTAAWVGYAVRRRRWRG
jgi:hypothetical protein